MAAHTRDRLQELLRAVDRDVLRPGGWDAPPQVWTVRADDDTDELSPSRLSEFDHLAASVRGPGVDTPAQRLRILQRWFAQARPEAHPQVEAMVYACEAWMVSATAIGQAEADRILEEARKRHLDEHPERVEVRQLLCVDRHGAVRSLVYARDNDSELTETSSADASPEAPGWSGDIVSGLERVMATINARAAAG